MEKGYAFARPFYASRSNEATAVRRVKFANVHRDVDERLVAAVGEHDVRKLPQNVARRQFVFKICGAQGQNSSGAVPRRVRLRVMKHVRGQLCHIFLEL